LNKNFKIEECKKEVLKLIKNQGVVYDREIRYRLESKYPHDVTKNAIDQLLKEGKIKKTNVPGRRGAGDMPNVFYRLPGSDYRRLIQKMREKLDLSIFIAGVSKEMGRHAEIVWWKAFKKHGWKLIPEREEEVGRGIREHKGRVASVNNDIDFVAEKDGVEYGVEIKNGLGYPDDLYWKFRVAAELNLIPMIIARWLNPAQINLIPKLGGVYIIYKDAIYSTTYKEVIDRIRSILNLPIEARNEIDEEFFKRKVEETHKNVLKNLKEYKRKIEDFLIRTSYRKEIRRTLGDKKQ